MRTFELAATKVFIFLSFAFWFIAVLAFLTQVGAEAWHWFFAGEWANYDAKALFPNEIDQLMKPVSAKGLVIILVKKLLLRQRCQR